MTSSAWNYWKSVLFQSWTETKNYAKEHSELTILGIAVAIIAVGTLWYTLGKEPAREEVIARLLGTAAIILLMFWHFLIRLIAIPSERQDKIARSVVATERKLAELLNEFAHVLQLESIGVEARQQTDQQGTITARAIEYELKFKNGHNRPVRYAVVALSVSDNVQQNPGTSGGVIAANSSAAYYSQRLPVPIDTTLIINSRIDLTVEYGHPDQEPTRKMHKIMDTEAFPNGMISMRYVVDNDEPIVK